MRKSHTLVLDASKCVGCGLCQWDCVMENIRMENGKPVFVRERCIYCGHCEAICPRHAITLTGFTDEPEEFDRDTRLDPDTLLKAMQTRRSVRHFKSEAVPEEVLHRIIEAGRLAPTGGNSQNTAYIVLRDKKDELEAAAVKLFRKLATGASAVAPAIRDKTLDDRFFFKGAPLAIVITSGSQVDGSLAAENMAFMAEACGLGVLYSGFFTICANTNRQIRAQLGIKKGQKAVTTLVIGYPDVTYHRTARREDADVTVL